MLSRLNRLRAQEVVVVLKQGRNLSGGRYLSAKMLPADQNHLSSSGTMRVAVVVSKKTAKTNVMRNRVRRGVYEALQKASQQENISDITPAHIVFFVRSIPANNMQQSFVHDIRTIISQLPAHR